jgi:hypothetical protein
MRISSRRRLTLAPGWSATTVTGSGSRFSCLQQDEGGAESSSGDSTTASRRRKSDEELAEEFWADIGYPTPASRVWERPSSRRASAQASPALKEGESSAVPAIHSMVAPQGARGTSGAPSSRVLVRPWIGPIPPPRVSPPRTMGDVLKPASHATAAVATPARSTQLSVPASPNNDAARSLGLGLQSKPGLSDQARSLRMVNLNRWLFHLWNRTTHRRNPNLTRSYAAVVSSAGMNRDTSAPPGPGTARSTAPVPLSSDASSSGGAPGFAPGVFTPVNPSMLPAHNTTTMTLPQLSSVPMQPQQQLYQVNMPQQFYQQQPIYQAPAGYMQNQAPAYTYQPAGPFLQQSQGQTVGAQPIAFNAGPANAPGGGQSGIIRPRKPKGAKGGRPKNRPGVAPSNAAPTALATHGLQGAPAFVPGALVTAAQPVMAPVQQQVHLQAAPIPGARTAIAKLWCTKCQAAGHLADDCETQQFCFICNKSNHPMTLRRCPALKMPKPAAMLCGYGTENMAFFSDAG